ncbi:MAG: translation initiation factor eIF-2B, partial [Promethearchaeota archaeon]
LEIQNIQKIIRELKEDNTSGASEFIDKSLEIIITQLEQVTDPYKDIKEDLIYLLKQIIDTRPSMAPLINTMGYLIHDLEKITKIVIEERLSEFKSYREKIIKALEFAFQSFLKENKKLPLKVMLLSYSSTIINLLLKNKEYEFEIYVLESRPLLEGQHVAEILSSRFKTHLIIDSAMGNFIDEIDVVLIGVDSILKDGSIINKVGTFTLAVLASTSKVKVYAVCDSYKYNLKSHYGYSVLIKEKPIREVYDKEIINKFLEVHNFYFDITPPEYISGIISELGILTIKEFLEKVKKVLPIEWFKYFLNNKEI